MSCLGWRLDAKTNERCTWHKSIVKNRPTDSQIAEFDSYIVKWQTELGLLGWRIERGKKSAQKGAMAEVECQPEPRLAVYRIGDWGGEEITSESLCKTALHEVLHILLFDLIEVARDSKSDDVALSATEHTVINVLERLIFEARYES